MKLPFIQGREIVPVRLIPLITNAWLGQETLSGILANRVKVSGWPYASDCDQIEVGVYDEDTDSTELSTITRAELIGPQQRDNGVHAYHVNDDGTPVRMRPTEWEAIYREISVLERTLRKVEEKNGVPDAMEFAWRLKATKILPPGVFFWRDDLDILWQTHISCFIPTKFERPDSRKMNYDSYIRPEYCTLVWEGFEHLIQTCKTSSLPPLVSADTPVVRQFQKIEKQAEPPVSKVRPPQLDRTGRKGVLQTLIIEGLKDFHESKKHWPKPGNAFQDFLTFIHDRFSVAKVKPDYMAGLEVVKKTSGDNETCLGFTVKRTLKSYNRKYVEDQFHKIKAVITPK